MLGQLLYDLSTSSPAQRNDFVEDCERRYGVYKKGSFYRQDIEFVLSFIVVEWLKNIRKRHLTACFVGDTFGAPATFFKRTMEEIGEVSLDIFGFSSAKRDSLRDVVRHALPTFRYTSCDLWGEDYNKLLNYFSSIENLESFCFSAGIFIEPKKHQRPWFFGKEGVRECNLHTLSPTLHADFVLASLEMLLRTVRGPLVLFTRKPFEDYFEDYQDFFTGYVKRLFLKVFHCNVANGQLSILMPKPNNFYGKVPPLVSAIQTYDRNKDFQKAYDTIQLKPKANFLLKDALGAFSKSIIKRDFCDYVISRLPDSSEHTIRLFEQHEKDPIEIQQEKFNERYTQLKKVRTRNIIKECDRKPHYVRVYLSRNATSLSFSCGKSAYPVVMNWLSMQDNVRFPNGHAVNTFVMQLRLINIYHDETFLERFEAAMVSYGIETVVDYAAERFLEKYRRAMKRKTAPFEQWVRHTKINGEETIEWKEHHKEDGKRNADPAVYQMFRQRLREEFPDPGTTWKYLYDDAARMAMTGCGFGGHKMALGKTRLAIMLCYAFGGNHNLFVVEAKTVSEWMKEITKLGLEDKVRQITCEDDLDNLSFINIIPYTRLWRELRPEHVRYRVTILSSGEVMPVSKDEYDMLRASQMSNGKMLPKRERQFDFEKKIPFKHTFCGWLSRRGNICVAVADEVHRASNDSSQGISWQQLKAKHKYGMSGTLVSNKPKAMLRLDTSVAGECTPLNPYSYKQPYYDVSTKEYSGSGFKRFEERFVQFVTVYQNGKQITKEIPAAADKEAWWDLHDPLILRRRPEEPEVNRVVDFSTADVQEVIVRADKKHVLFYKKWLMEYGTWFLEKLSGGKKAAFASTNQILGHLSKLRLVSTVPGCDKVSGQDIDPSFRWPGGKTKLQNLILDDVNNMVEKQGLKFIIFSSHPDFLKEMHTYFTEEYGIEVGLFTGDIPIDKRIKTLNHFRDEDTMQGLLMSTGAANTAYNIPEASYVWIADWDWDPAKLMQAWHRILRNGQQLEHPVVKIAIVEGTIQQYMSQWGKIKLESSADLIDKQDFEFDPQTWVALTDFLIAMMQREGIPGFESFPVSDRIKKAMDNREPVFSEAM